MKAKILIVEDSFIVALHLQTTLESENYEVVAKLESGEAALAFLEKQKPDLVLMDIMLGGELDGIETATQIRNKFFLPVIYITALTDRETIQRAKITEPFGYLTKPFEDREIFTVIEMALYKHGIDAKLRSSEERFFSTVNSISDAVVVINNDFKITYMNPSAEGMTQFTLAEALDKNIDDVVRLKDQNTEEFPVNPIQCELRAVKHNTMPDQLILITKRGIEKPIGESSLSPLLDNYGNLTGLVLIFKDITEKREHERLLRDLDKQKMMLILEGQEQERSRIAKDLHDGLGQMLNAIKMNVNVLVKSQAEANALYKLIDEAIQESKRMAENLLPSKLKDFDLATCIRSLCNQITTENKQITFFSSGTVDTLKQSNKVNLYRIVQEAINNAVKHSEAKHIAVNLNEEHSRIRLSIEDDGKGMVYGRTDEANQKRGLVNMRERAEIMGGSLSIESDAARGTLVIVEVPV